MRLIKTLLIDGAEYPVVSEDIILNLSGSSSANIVVAAEQIPKGIVTFDVGYSTGTIQRFFIGYIEKATRQSADHYSLFCRELSSALQVHCPISLRQCTLSDVLRVITKATYLKFKVGTETKIQSRFNSMGNGYDVIANLARIFSIDDFVWYQQVDGVIYVGSWQDSFWKGKEVELSEDYFQQQQSNNKASIPLISSIRPGTILNNQRLEQVRLIENRMLIKWQ